MARQQAFAGWVRPPYGGGVISASPAIGNVILVDQVNGNDVTGTVNGFPVQTVEAAINYINANALTGITIWVAPGTYSLSAGITMPAGCALRGFNTQTTRIQLAASNPGGTVTLLTMGNNTRVEDVSLSLTSTNATTNLVGIALPGSTSQNSKFRTCVLTVDNSSVATGSTTTVTGILSNGSAPPSNSDWSFNFSRGCTVNVLSNGAGNKRAVLCSTASVVTFRDTNFYCAPPVDPASTGSYVAVATTDNQALCQLRCCTLGGGVDGGGAYTGSDIAQFAPATGGGTTAYGIVLGDGTDLVNHRALDLPFSTAVNPSLLIYNLRGNVANLPRYYWFGHQTSADATEVFIRAQERILIYGLFIVLRQAPGVGNSVTVTVRKSLTGVPGSGVATTMTATISGAATSATFYGSSVQFDKGEFLSVQSTSTGGTPQDLTIQVDTY